MDRGRCDEAARLLLTCLTTAKQARADRQRAILALAQNYTATQGTTIDDGGIDQLIEDVSPRDGAPAAARWIGSIIDLNTGRFSWTSPLGFRYITDSDGTHRIE